MRSQNPNPNRRTHDAQLKAAVIAACRERGASAAAVALAHGLNANLVRKWLVGRGLKRCGLQSALARGVPAPASTPLAQAAPALQFVPVQLPPPAGQATSASGGDEAIEIELTRAGVSLKVRCPAAQAGACASWLGELVPVLAR
jgi:transposase